VQPIGFRTAIRGDGIIEWVLTEKEGGMRQTADSYVMQIKVGLFVSLGVILVVGAMLHVGRHGRLFSSTLSMSLLIPRADGLMVGAPVRLAGIEIGVVTGMTLTADPGTSGVRVDLALDAVTASHLKADATAALRSQGLLGETYVDLQPGRATQTWQETQPVVTGATFPQPEEVFAQLSSTVETFQELLKGVQTGQGSVGKLARDPQLYTNLVQLTDEVAKTLQALNDRSGTLGQLLHSPALYERLTGVLHRVETLLQQAGSARSTVGKLLHGPDLYDHSAALLGEMRRAVRQINTLLGALNGPHGTAGQLLNDGRLYQESREALQRLTAVAQRLDRVLTQFENSEGTVGQLLADPTLYRNLNTLISNINQLVQDIRSNPKRYLSVKIF
jgi:phospholipid/cholesterol/gamma-HCH transport system substrate-binding protein